ncbi:efflux RND transporter periplasmic adaptor subunit [Frigidibacter mobilis]|nr:efflux RND transporter periplasmic adaptor subunit [Frigidibacter mobilis]
MNMTSETPPFAEALRSLTLAPSADPAPPPGRSARRRILLAASLAGAGIALSLAIGRAVMPDTAAEPVLLAAATAPPTMADSVQSVLPRREVTGSGYVVAPDETAVFALYEGRITGILVAPGDRVAAGQVLVTLADATAGFALEQAQAARAAAELVLAARRIELAQAEISLGRISALATRRAVSLQEHDEAQTARDLAANGVLQARQSLKDADLVVRMAQDRVAELTIRAPIPGTVTRMAAHLGDSVLGRADAVREDQSLLTITDTSRLVIDADVAEASLSILHPGLRGEAILDSYPGHPFAVEILRIAPVIFPAKGTVSLRLGLTAPPAGIRPAMAARIRIPTESQPGEGPQ